MVSEMNIISFRVKAVDILEWDEEIGTLKKPSFVLAMKYMTKVALFRLKCWIRSNETKIEQYLSDMCGQ